MPNTPSAKKRLRSDVRRRFINRAHKSRVKTSEQRLPTAIEAADADAAKAALVVCFAELDRAAKHGTIHKNKADRKKQRLSLRVNKLA
jgi:small subunit ribosomal protein S20